MELTVLEKELENRTTEELDRLAAYLAVLRAKRSPAHQHELGRKLESSDGWMSLGELKTKLSVDRIGK